jgi:hypothetical protein
MAGITDIKEGPGGVPPETDLAQSAVPEAPQQALSAEAAQTLSLAKEGKPESFLRRLVHGNRSTGDSPVDFNKIKTTVQETRIDPRTAEFERKEVAAPVSGWKALLEKFKIYLRNPFLNTFLFVPGVNTAVYKLFKAIGLKGAFTKAMEDIDDVTERQKLTAIKAQSQAAIAENTPVVAGTSEATPAREISPEAVAALTAARDANRFTHPMESDQPAVNNPVSADQAVPVPA